MKFVGGIDCSSRFAQIGRRRRWRRDNVSEAVLLLVCGVFSPTDIRLHSKFVRLRSHL